MVNVRPTPREAPLLHTMHATLRFFCFSRLGTPLAPLDNVADDGEAGNADGDGDDDAADDDDADDDDDDDANDAADDDDEGDDDDDDGDDDDDDDDEDDDDDTGDAECETVPR